MSDREKGRTHGAPRTPLRIAILGRRTNGNEAIIAGIEHKDYQLERPGCVRQGGGTNTSQGAAHGITLPRSPEGLPEGRRFALWRTPRELILRSVHADSRELFESDEGRILNVPSSLLPELQVRWMLNPRLAIERMQATGDDVSGCTVHLVTSEVDAGRILLQRTCRITDDDTPITLKRKVQQLEGEALCTCIKAAVSHRGDLSKVRSIE
jgi:hypothetical protein